MKNVNKDIAYEIYGLVHYFPTVVRLRLHRYISSKISGSK